MICGAGPDFKAKAEGGREEEGSGGCDGTLLEGRESGAVVWTDRDD